MPKNVNKLKNVETSLHSQDDNSVPIGALSATFCKIHKSKSQYNFKTVQFVVYNVHTTSCDFRRRVLQLVHAVFPVDQFQFEHAAFQFQFRFFQLQFLRLSGGEDVSDVVFVADLPFANRLYDRCVDGGGCW